MAVTTDQYLNVGQNDLHVEAIWYEDLTGYAAKLRYCAEGDDPDAAAEETATVIPGAMTSLTSFDFASDDNPFSASGYYLFWFEITKDSRTRSSRPVRRLVHAKGTGARRIP